jgi:molybdenum cofactor guanylyltransferase
MLGHILGILRPLFSIIVVVRAPGDGALPENEKAILAQDSTEGEGPLRGLEAGLFALPRSVERVYVSGCDTPLLRPALVELVLATFVSGQAQVPLVGGFPQPLSAAYRTNILSTVSQMLAEGQRSLQSMLGRIDTRWVPEEQIRHVDPNLESFENANTPEDFQRIMNLKAMDP